MLVPHYAGDTIDLVVERGAGNAAPHRITAHVRLVASLPPWRRAVLGIVPSRSVRPPPTDAGDREAHQQNPKGGDPSKGVTVAWVWPDTPAAKAGVVAGDRIVSIEGQNPDGQAGGKEKVTVDSAAMLAGLIGGMEIGQRLRLSVLRGKETLSGSRQYMGSVWNEKGGAIGPVAHGEVFFPIRHTPTVYQRPQDLVRRPVNPTG